MNKPKIFKTVSNETTTCKDSTFTISAICDDDGSFEISIEGNGGADYAIKAAESLMRILKNN